MEENEIDQEKLDLNTVAVRRIPPVLVELLINKKKGTRGSRYRCLMLCDEFE